MALSGQSDATALFSAVRYTLCDTYIDFPQSVNSGKSILRRKTILRSKGDSGLSYSGIDEIPVSSYADGKLTESHFGQTKPSYKSLSR
jgi:hypothetical protein